MARMRLKKGDISIRELLLFSRHWYKQEDNKEKRARLDIKSGRITARKGLSYNRATKSWSQSSREVRLDFLIKSSPVSYKDTSGLKNHYYPLTILIKDWSKGMNSPLRWRTSSLAKPRFPKKKVSDQKSPEAKKKVRDENLKIQQENIKRGVQMQWFFEISWVAQKWGLIFGPNYAKSSPKKSNPTLMPFYDKHMYYVVKKILPSLLNDPKLRQRFQNEEYV